MDRRLPILALWISALWLPAAAHANCRNNKPICGNPNICHSDRRSTNRNDLNQPVHGTVCSVLNDMEKKFGPIEVLAAYRADNAQRDGAPDSVHLQQPGGPSFAVDVYRPAERRKMYEFLGNEKCKGIRYNIYCATGTIHVDFSRKKDNYSGCRDFFRSQCKNDGGTTPPRPEPRPQEPPKKQAEPYKSPAVDRYQRRPATPGTPRCWNSQRWGSCCGPIRKRNGYCSG